MTISRKKEPLNYPKKISQQKTKKVENVLEKQMLIDLEKRISLNVGSYLVLTEEGDPTQIALAHQKAKSEFLKFAPEMSRLALHLGGEISYVVADFLDSVDVVLHNDLLDEDKIARCFHTTQRLQAELKQ
jgi:predicted methyltransferase